MIEIKSTADLDSFIYQTDGFHDGLLHEMAWKHPGWVDAKESMHSAATATAL